MKRMLILYGISIIIKYRILVTIYIYRIFRKQGQYFFFLTHGPRPIHRFTLLMFFFCWKI